MNESDPAGEVMDQAPSAQDDFWATHAPNQPTSSGRMFISPTPVPTLSPDEQAALQARLAAATSAPMRQPIVPPTGNPGVTMPDMGAGIRAAFAHLPVDQAVKAIETAMQYQGQRGYQQDTQNGMTSAQALAKWGPMLFSRSPTGIATALRLGQTSQVPQMTPAQVSANQIAQRSLALREAAAKKVKAPTVRVPLNPNEPFGAVITGAADDPAVVEAMKKAQGATATGETPKPSKGIVPFVNEILFGSPAPAAAGQIKAPGATSFKEGARIRSKKDGKMYRVTNGVPVLEKGQ